MNDRRPQRNARTALHCVVIGIAVVAVPMAGCMPTISMHSYRNVVVTMTDSDSGAPIAHRPFRVVYEYSPADSPLVYHVELRTPDDVRAETDAEGKAVVRLADYAWDIYLYVDDINGEGHTWFGLTKNLIRKGGVSKSNAKTPLEVELCPVTQPDHTSK